MAEFVSNLDPTQALLDSDAALLQGRATDGGVLCFNPNKADGQYPQVSLEQLKDLAGRDYVDIADFVIQRLVGDDVDRAELRAISEAAYADSNFPLAPDGKVVTSEEIAFGVNKAGLSNGLTGSFKDIGMFHLSNNTQRVVDQRPSGLLIVTASTGDTWPSAEKSHDGLDGLSLVGFSPSQKGASSPFQNMQMQAYASSNVHNVKVNASFDRIVETLNAIKDEPMFAELGGVNSVNVMRLIPQVPFHFAAYFETVGENVGEVVDVYVPSGNFGDAFSLYIAKRMGLPIGKIVLGNTEENNALHNLVQTGRYDKRESKITTASAMDIMAPANLPRLIFDMLEGDVRRMKDFSDRYNRLGTVALYNVGLSSSAMKDWGFESGTVDDATIRRTIEDIYRESGVIIEPHTAVATALALRRSEHTGNRAIVYETAHPIKFGELLHKILGVHVEVPDHYVGLEEQARSNPYKTRTIDSSQRAMRAVLAEHM